MVMWNHTFFWWNPYPLSQKFSHMFYSKNDSWLEATLLPIRTTRLLQSWIHQHVCSAEKVATLRPFAIRRMASLTTRENTFARIVGRLDILWMYVTRSMVFHPRPLSQSESRSDDEPKRKREFEKEIWSRHHSYSGKLWKTIKIKQVCEKSDFGSGSRLRVGKVLASYRARSRAVPLIKNAKLMWFSKY